MSQIDALDNSKSQNHVECWTVLEAKLPITKKLTKAIIDGQLGWTKSNAGDMHPKHFRVKVMHLNSLAELHYEIASANQRQCLIHGTPLRLIDDNEYIARRSVHFLDCPHRVFVIDVDDFQHLGVSLKTPKIAEAGRAAVARLPVEFHGAQYLVQATSGHGIKQNEARLRLFFWLDRAITLAEANAWASIFDLNVDRSIYRTVQPIYIAPPVIEGSKVDPIKERLVMSKSGSATVAVPADLSAKTAERVARSVTAPSGVILDAAHMINEWVGTLHGRTSESIQSRHIAFLGAARDARDRAIADHVVEPLIALWAFGDDAPAESDGAGSLTDDARAMLIDAGVPPDEAANIIGGILRAHDKVADRMTEGDPIDVSDVERMVGDAWNGTVGVFGSLWKEPTSGKAMGSVVDEDDEAAPKDYRLAIITFKDAMRDIAEAGGGCDEGDAALKALETILAGSDEGERVLAHAMQAVASLALDAEAVEADLAKMGVPANRKTKKPIVVSATDFIASYKPVRAIVGKVVRAGYVYFLTAPTYHGKTALLTVLSLALAMDRADMIGMPVKPCRVVYATFENPEDFRTRLMAACLHYGIKYEALRGRLDIIQARVAVDVMRKEIAKGGDAGMIVVDTLQAAFSGQDFNDNKEALDFLRALRGLTDLPGSPTMMVAAHPVKNPDKGNLVPYGGGSVLNECDGNLTMWKDKVSGIVELHFQAKLRGPAFDPIKFRIDIAPRVGMPDDDGDPLAVPVAVPMTAEEACKAEVPRMSTEDVLLLAIHEKPEGTVRDWAEMVRISTSSVNKCGKLLIEAAMATKSDRGKLALTPAGTAKAEALADPAARAFGHVDDTDDEAEM